MTRTVPAAGANRARRARRLMKEAIRAAGRCLHHTQNPQNPPGVVSLPSELGGEEEDKGGEEKEDVRRSQKRLCQPEEARAVLDVQHRPVAQRVQPGVEVGIIPVVQNPGSRD